MREGATLYAARCSSALAIACATVLPLQRRRGRCVTICIYVHAGERAQLKTSPLKAISARPTTVDRKTKVAPSSTQKRRFWTCGTPPGPPPSRWTRRRARSPSAAPKRTSAHGAVFKIFRNYVKFDFDYYKV